MVVLCVSFVLYERGKKKSCLDFFCGLNYPESKFTCKLREPQET